MNERIRYESAERVRDYYRNQGAAKEQQRIIQLLQEQADGYLIDPYYIEPIISLIKGETK
jgi:hypothetical protein